MTYSKDQFKEYAHKFILSKVNQIERRSHGTTRHFLAGINPRKPYVGPGGGFSAGSLTPGEKKLLLELLKREGVKG